MKALVFLYRGREVTDEVELNMARHLQDASRSVEVYRCSDEDVTHALISKVERKSNKVVKEQSNIDELRKAVDAAETYIGEKVLKNTLNPSLVAYIIGRLLALRDTKLLTALRLIAENEELVTDIRFSREIIDIIKQTINNNVC